jgi:hypothetical protein
MLPSLDFSVLERQHTTTVPVREITNVNRCN